MILRQRIIWGLATPLVEKAAWRNFCQVIGSDASQVIHNDSSQVTASDSNQVIQNDAQKFSVLSFYHLKPLVKPSEIRQDVEDFLRDHSAKGRVYIHNQGVNASMCVPQEHKNVVEKYFCKLLDVKPSSLRVSALPSSAQVSPKLRVSNRKLLEGASEWLLGDERGKHVGPDEWNRALREEVSQGKAILMDVRNQYEWEVGRFKGAESPGVDHFKQFPDLAEKLEKKVDKEETPLLMYCTGGIRCEVFSSLLISRGWKDVRQLEGGVLAYGESSDTSEWEGNLFVFDDRLVVPIDGVVGGELDQPIAKCVFCGTVAEMCFNCNSMRLVLNHLVEVTNTKNKFRCNAVFVACPSCAHTHKGCCSEECSKHTKQHFIPRNR